MPCLNSSGNVASEASSKPSARRPFQVKATVTQRLSISVEARTSAADCTFARIADSQARPPAALRNERNSYRPVSAGTRVSRMCWMSSNSSMARPMAIHCIWSSMFENAALSLQGLLDFVATHVGMLAVFEKAWTLVVAEELDEGRRILCQSAGQPSRFSKTVDMPVLPKRATASSVYLSKSVSKMP